MLEFTLIESDDSLTKLCEKLSLLKVIGIDLECENNLHHYGAYITLIQLFDGVNSYVLDILKINNMEPLLSIFRNFNIQKVFHDVSFDLRIIKAQWGCQVVNIFDTQIAASFTGRDKVGLSSLLEEFLNIRKEKKFQRVDWTKRPMSDEMISYAVKDAAYLLKLQDILKKELSELNRLDWVNEECENLESLDWSYHEQEYLDVSGVKSMSGNERAIFRVLFNERKKMAQKVDKPPFMIFGNKQMISFSKNPPHDWIQLKGVHPIVIEEATKLKKMVEEASVVSEDLPRKEKKRLSPKQYEWTKKLLIMRNKITNQIGIKGHLLLNNDQIRDLAVTQSLDQLREWQKNLVKNEKLISEIMRSL